MLGSSSYTSVIVANGTLVRLGSNADLASRNTPSVLKLDGFFRTATKSEVRSEAFSAIQTVMRRSIRHRAATFLAMLAIILQVLLPGTLAVAASNDVDVSRFICVSHGQLSPEAKAAIEQLAKLSGDEAPAHQPSNGHCPLCILVHVMPLPEPAPVATSGQVTSAAGYICHEAGGFARKTRTLPLGSRGPPLHL